MTAKRIANKLILLLPSKRKEECSYFVDRSRCVKKLVDRVQAERKPNDLKLEEIVEVLRTVCEPDWRTNGLREVLFAKYVNRRTNRLALSKTGCLMLPSIASFQRSNYKKDSSNNSLRVSKLNSLLRKSSWRKVTSRNSRTSWTWGERRQWSTTGCHLKKKCTRFPINLLAHSRNIQRKWKIPEQLYKTCRPNLIYAYLRMKWLRCATWWPDRGDSDFP